MSPRYRLLATFAVGVLVAPIPLHAQSASGPAASQLRALLDARKLDTFAARMPGAQDTFAAALYIPGQQLILVSGRYGAPSLLRERNHPRPLPGGVPGSVRRERPCEPTGPGRPAG